MFKKHKILLEENELLKKQILRMEKEKFNEENSEMIEEKKKLVVEVGQLKKKTSFMKTEISQLDLKNQRLMKEVKAKENEINEVKNVKEVIYNLNNEMYDLNLKKQRIMKEMEAQEVKLRKYEELNKSIYTLRNEIYDLSLKKQILIKETEDENFLFTENELIKLSDELNVINPAYTLENITDDLANLYRAFIKEYNMTYITYFGIREELTQMVFDYHFFPKKFTIEENRKQEDRNRRGAFGPFADSIFKSVKFFFDLLEQKGYPVYENTHSFVMLIFEFKHEDYYISQLYKYPFIHNLKAGEITLDKLIPLFLIEHDDSFDSIFFWRLQNKLGIHATSEEVEEAKEKVKIQLRHEKLERVAKQLEKKEEENLLSTIDFEDMSGIEFETFVGNVLQRLGFSVTQTKASGDQGVDLIATRNAQKYVIQTKRYASAVNNKAIQEVVSGKEHYKADYSWVITNNSFTRGAIELAASTKTLLWDGKKLKEMIQFAEQ